MGKALSIAWYKLLLELFTGNCKLNRVCATFFVLPFYRLVIQQHCGNRNIANIFYWQVLLFYYFCILLCPQYYVRLLLCFYYLPFLFVSMVVYWGFIMKINRKSRRPWWHLRIHSRLRNKCTFLTVMHYNKCSDSV